MFLNCNLIIFHFLKPLHHLTSATEGYPPNVKLCEKVLAPLGYDIAELHRALKPGGFFITQQVGEDNDRELVELLLPGTPKSFPGWNLHNQVEAFTKQGFQVLRREEAFRPICFYDVGALVWFARIIEWEYPGFSVESCFERLLEAQRMIEEKGQVEGSIHRFMIVVKKPL